MSIQPQTTGTHPEDISADAARALTECMTVVVNDPECWSDDEVMVYSSSGARYTVNVAVGFCECPSDQYHDGPCKHRERAAYALGHKQIPSWVDRDRVDPVLLDRRASIAAATATQEA